MQTITLFAFEIAAIHTMIGFQVPDNRFDGLTPFELFFLFGRQSLGLATVHGKRTVNHTLTSADYGGRFNWCSERVAIDAATIPQCRYSVVSADASGHLSDRRTDHGH